jgi:hypothetical protein
VLPINGFNLRGRLVIDSVILPPPIPRYFWMYIDDLSNISIGTLFSLDYLHYQYGHIGNEFIVVAIADDVSLIDFTEYGDNFSKYPTSANTPLIVFKVNDTLQQDPFSILQKETELLNSEPNLENSHLVEFINGTTSNRHNLVVRGSIANGEEKYLAELTSITHIQFNISDLTSGSVDIHVKLEHIFQE